MSDKKQKKYIYFLSIFFAIALTITPLGQALAQSSNEVKQGGAADAGVAFIGSTAQCSAGQILANLLASSVSGVIGQIKGSVKSSLKNTVTKKVGSIIAIGTPKEVPVNDPTLRADVGRQTAAKVGGSSYSDVTGAIFGGIGDVSWDSVAFCIANEMIRYIGQSTIQWIQSGFEGNPVFIDNTSAYFQGLADQEAGTFIQQLVGKTTGINVCAPFRVRLAVDTLNSYGGVNYRGNPLNCSLSQIENNFEQFTGGDWSAGGFPGWFELIQMQNNPYGAQILANQQLLGKIYARQNTATIELNWSNGYRSFKVCSTREDAEGNCEKRPDGTDGEVTTTLGGYIESTVNARGAMPGHRLEIAQTFDQVVSSLVNELIKIAVTDLFTPTSNSGQISNSFISQDELEAYNYNYDEENPYDIYLSLNSQNPAGRSVVADQGADNNQYDLLPTLVFNIESTDSSAILRSLVVNIYTSGDDPATIVTARLFDSLESELGSATVLPSGTAGQFTATFNNLNYLINRSDTETFVIAIDIDGTTETPTLVQTGIFTTDISLYDSGGNLFNPLSEMDGSAVGNVFSITN